MSDESRAEAADWLALAAGDLIAARASLAGDFEPRRACFWAQQCGEKAVKGVLVLLGVDFPFTHDLDGLRDLIPLNWKFVSEFPDLSHLTLWAVKSRYDPTEINASAADADRAVELAGRLLDGIRRDLASHDEQHETS